MALIAFNSKQKSKSRPQLPGGLRLGCTVACLLGLRVRIPPAAWTPVSCECCLLLSRGLCDRPITRPEESVMCLSVVLKPQQRRGLEPLGLSRHAEFKNLSLRSW